VAAVRRLSFLPLLAAVLAACGGSSSSAPDPGAAVSTTTAERAARFTLLVDAVVGAARVESSETGTIAFAQRRAHLYKLLPGSGQPQEVIVDGPFTYTNANVEAALRDRSVKPWTKLDTRRLSATQRRGRPDELAHVLALVYLPDGMDRPTRLDSLTVAGERVTEFRGLVHPARVPAHAPAGLRGSLAQALRNDYPAKPFPASVWLDDAGRVRRVLVSYNTAGGTEISLDGRFSRFGTTVDTTPPPARSIEDISP
jgi:hypothetical protein